MSRAASDPLDALILVADDDQLLRAQARDALGQEGFSVVEAGSGTEALAAFERSRPALVLLDVNMPELDGFAACRALRERHPGDRTPILMMTSAEDRDPIDRAYEAGATDFIPKPINWPLLGHRVRYLVRSGRAFAALRRSQLSLSTAQRIARLGSWEWNSETNEMLWSDEIYHIFGLEPGAVEANHLNWWNCIHPEDRDFVRGQVRQALDVSKTYSVEHRLLVGDDAVKHVRQQGEAVSDERGRWLVGTLQDITDQKRAQEEIRYLANYDSLTGLANRRFFMDRLEEAIASAGKREQYVGLLYMDLDRFKRINDTLGHSAGDQLLRSVADLLRRHVRGSDTVGRMDPRAPTSSVSRLGGDEFTILLSELPSPEVAGDVARRILRDLPAPLSIEGYEVSITGSIGIALYPTDGGDVETLVRNADTAMYHAKDHGRNNFQFFCSTMNAASIRKFALESHLRRALKEEALTLSYQPRVDLATGEVTAAEALLRWNSPELGTVSPKEIIPVAEETGLITPLGAWVLHRACTQNKAWQDAGYRPIPISVNVSARQFVREDLRQTVSQALTATGLDPGYLEIEITESVMLQDDESVALMLRDLQAMGVRVLLDDFGTGYSSLSYVSRFPLDGLKMDRCFVRDVDSDPAAAGVVAAVIAMAHSLGVRVVAEGVDSDEQARLLREYGCDEMQGFITSGAVAPSEFVRFFEATEGGSAN